MSIKDGKLITFKHTIVDQDGRTISVNRRKTLYKPGSMHDKLYHAIKELNVGDKAQVEFSKSELGRYNQEKVITLPRYQFSGFPNDQIVKGMVFKTQLNETPHLGYVTDFDDDSITIDTNPILLILNKDVSFLIELEEVEEPSADIGSRDQYNYSDLLLSDDDSINIFP